MLHVTARAAAAAVCAGLLMSAACQRTGGDETAPMLTEDHGLLVVPADSPLRQQLVVQPVGAGAAARQLQLPAVVEADPADVTNILSPLTGRVTALKVRLGDRVRRGQVLAVIASGDMAQANSDVEKAEDAFATADKALTRARGVQQAGGAASTNDPPLAAAEPVSEASRVRARSSSDLAWTSPLSAASRSLAAEPPACSTPRARTRALAARS